MKIAKIKDKLTVLVLTKNHNQTLLIVCFRGLKFFKYNNFCHIKSYIKNN